MTGYNQVLLSILLTFGVILIIVLIILSIKSIITVDKMNIILNDVEKKLKSVNGFFNCLDAVSDTIDLLSNTLIDKVLGLFNRITQKGKEEENE